MPNDNAVPDWLKRGQYLTITKEEVDDLYNLQDLFVY
jgi:hypothetical protein